MRWNAVATCVLGILFTLIAGCANNPTASVVKLESSQIAAGDARLAARDFPSAREYFEQARSNSLIANKEDYLAKGIYLQKVAANSRLAFIELHQGDVATAGSKYRNAIELLRKDYEAHQVLLAELRKASETSNEIKKGLLAGLAGLGLSRIEEGVSSDILSEIGVFSAAGTLIQKVINVPPPQNKAAPLAGSAVDASLLSLRIPVIPDTDYFRYVGRVISGDSSCTGSLVGPGLVLTNAHCIFDGGVDYNKGPTSLKPGSFQFRREWLYQTDQFDVKTFYTHKGIEGDWDGQIKNDWAILQLFEGNGVKIPKGYFASRADISDGIDPELQLNRSYNVTIPGYSNDRNEGVYLTLDAGCQVDPDGLYGSIVLHDCDTFKGSSGAPVLYLDSLSRPTVVSVNVGKKGGRGEFRGIMIPPKRWYPTLKELLDKVK